MRRKDKPGVPPDDPEQSKRFIEAARGHSADDTDEGAKRAFQRVVTAPKKSK